MPVIDHLRGFVQDVEKYKVVQFFFPCREDKNKEDCSFSAMLFLKLKLVGN